MIFISFSAIVRSQTSMKKWPILQHFPGIKVIIPIKIQDCTTSKSNQNETIRGNQIQID